VRRREGDIRPYPFTNSTSLTNEKSTTAKTFSPTHVASLVPITIAQASAADLTAILGGASDVVPAAKTDRTTEFDDSVFIVNEYTLYKEVKHGDKNSARLFLCNDLEANEFGEFEGGDDESRDDGETFSEFEGDGEYSEEYDKYDE
jgi:hypothetical protein